LQKGTTVKAFEHRVLPLWGWCPFLRFDNIIPWFHKFWLEVSQENKGVSAARNARIEAANGNMYNF